MSKQELDNLVRIGKLKLEPPRRTEFDGMVRSARSHLADAQNESIDTDSQFDLAYGAAHRLASAALRQHATARKIGLRCSKRWFTPSAQAGLTSRFSSKPIMSGIWRNTKDVLKSTRAFSPSSSAVRKF
ncbi:MAG: hypothetical protein WAU57_12730 [Xanthobacteraceae bacterium]